MFCIFNHNKIIFINVLAIELLKHMLLVVFFLYFHCFIYFLIIERNSCEWNSFEKINVCWYFKVHNYTENMYSTVNILCACMFFVYRHYHEKKCVKSFDSLKSETWIKILTFKQNTAMYQYRRGLLLCMCVLMWIPTYSFIIFSLHYKKNR